MNDAAQAGQVAVAQARDVVLFLASGFVALRPFSSSELSASGRSGNGPHGVCWLRR